MKLERRFTKAEVRATEGDLPHIIGHGAVFNSESLDLGGFVEIVMPGCADACLASGPDIVGLWNHNVEGNDLPLGRTTSGTMTVRVDDVGIAYDIDPAPITICRDLIVSIRRGDVNASSFGFYTLEDTWDLDRARDVLIRRLQKVEIFDCSPVIFPAYPAADSGLRSAFAKAGNQTALGVADTELRARAAEARQLLTGAKKHFDIRSRPENEPAPLLSMESLLLLTELADLDRF